MEVLFLNKPKTNIFKEVRWYHLIHFGKNDLSGDIAIRMRQMGLSTSSRKYKIFAPHGFRIKSQRRRVVYNLLINKLSYSPFILSLRDVVSNQYYVNDKGIENLIKVISMVDLIKEE